MRNCVYWPFKITTTNALSIKEQLSHPHWFPHKSNCLLITLPVSGHDSARLQSGSAQTSGCDSPSTISDVDKIKQKVVFSVNRLTIDLLNTARDSTEVEQILF